MRYKIKNIIIVILFITLFLGFIMPIESGCECYNESNEIWIKEFRLWGIYYNMHKNPYDCHNKCKKYNMEFRNLTWKDIRG